MIQYNYKITHERLQWLLHYDPLTGVFSRRRDGRQAGTPHGNYRRIMVAGEFIYEHVLAWFYVHQEWPDDYVDHRDGDGTNNTIANLRVATPSANALNRQGPNANNRTGFLGVTPRPGGFRAAIRVRGKVYRSRTMKTAQAAGVEYQRLRALHAPEVLNG